MTDFHLQVFQVRTAAEAAAAASERGLRGGQASARLLQEGPAAPHTLLVDGLEVGLVALEAQGEDGVTRAAQRKALGEPRPGWHATASTSLGAGGGGVLT